MIKIINKAIFISSFLGLSFLSILLSCSHSANKKVDANTDDQELKGTFSAKGGIPLDGITSLQHFKATNEMSVLCTNPASGDFVQITFKDERSARSAQTLNVVKAFKSLSEIKNENEIDFTYFNNGIFYYSDSKGSGKVKTITNGEDFTIEFKDVGVVNAADEQVKYISGKISY